GGGFLAPGGFEKAGRVRKSSTLASPLLRRPLLGGPGFGVASPLLGLLFFPARLANPGCHRRGHGDQHPDHRQEDTGLRELQAALLLCGLLLLLLILPLLLLRIGVVLRQEDSRRGRSGLLRRGSRRRAEHSDDHGQNEQTSVHGGPSETRGEQRCQHILCGSSHASQGVSSTAYSLPKTAFTRSWSFDGPCPSRPSNGTSPDRPGSPPP